MPNYLLSIDGGGVRGIIPAVVLAKLERVTGKRCRDIFSFVAGTSTGALIAAAIAAGIPAERIVQMYLTRARDIFPQYRLNIVRRLVRGSMYSTQRLQAVIAEELGVARTWTLNDSPIDVLITAKRVRDGKPWYFVKDNARNAGTTGRLPLVDCVTASAAAPTYFPPWPVADLGLLVDGGVGVAGNPVYQACVEAFYYNTYQSDDMIVVSLGTGRFLAEKRPGWIAEWFEWLLGELLRSPGEQQTELVQRHFDVPFYRIDPELSANIALDNAGALGRLRQEAEQVAARIDWQIILAGADSPFRIQSENTLWYQYRQPVGG